MKLKTIAFAVLSTAITVSAHAGTDAKDMKEIAPVASAPVSDAAFYVAAYGGVDFSNSYGNKAEILSLGGSNADVTPSHVHSDIGGAGGIKFGYQFDSDEICEGFRLQPAVEAEAFYLGAQSKQNIAVPGVALDHEKFDFNSADFFVNGIVRFKIDGSPVTPYIGAGVGLQYITVHGEGNLPDVGVKVTGFDDDDVDFAAQVLGGLDFKIADHWTLFTEYKFVDAFATKMGTPVAAVPGLAYHYKPDQIAQQVATAGLKFDF